MAVELSGEQMEQLSSALSCGYGAEAADRFSEEFMLAVASALPPSRWGVAEEFGWDDTEVRDWVCSLAEEMLGTGDPELALEAHDAWLERRSPGPG